jgi:hypothetical protein
VTAAAPPSPPGPSDGGGGAAAATEPDAPSAAPGQPEAPASDPTQQIVNDPIVKRAVELFNGRIVHVEPWPKN